MRTTITLQTFLILWLSACAMVGNNITFEVGEARFVITVGAEECELFFIFGVLVGVLAVWGQR